MKLAPIRRTWYAFEQWRSQLRTARKYGGFRETLTGPATSRWTRFWLCGIRWQHQEKFAARGRCYRCGKALR